MVTVTEGHLTDAYLKISFRYCILCEFDACGAESGVLQEGGEGDHKVLIKSRRKLTLTESPARLTRV